MSAARIFDPELDAPSAAAVPVVEVTQIEEPEPPRRGITITKVARVDGFWYARVTMNGVTTEVTKRFGSWGSVPSGDGAWKEVHPRIAAMLQDKVVPIENAERKALEESKKR